MAHKFDGTWSYFESTNSGPVGSDGNMKLVIPNNGTVDETQSNHKNKKVRGDATNNTIHLFGKETGEETEYTGTLVFDDVVKGTRLLIIAGDFKTTATPLPGPEGGGLSAAPETNQNEGIWIITKP